MHLALHHELKKILPALIMLAVSISTQAQSVFCPPNIDFESGTLSNWNFYTGTCCPLNASTSSGPVANRHVLTSGTSVDPYGLFPIVSPGGGNYSLKLGNSSVGRQAERARYYIRVPNNQNDYVFIYRYAVVFQDPNHQVNDQPRFEVNAYDSATQVPVPCNQFTYVSSSVLPGFQQSSVNPGVYYKPWTTATINLTGYAGRTVALDFASGDCDLGGHFGYGYVDMNCGLFQIKGVTCNYDTAIILNGPPGFQSYKWMDTAFTNTISTSRTLTIAPGNLLAKYAVIVTPYTGFGCPDTFITTVSLDTTSLVVQVTPDTTVLCSLSNRINLQTNVTSTNTVNIYAWSPTAGLSCNTCPNPRALPTSTTTYTVIVEDEYGCKDTGDVTITIITKPEVNAGADAAVCINDSITLNGTSTSIGYSWYPTTNMTGANTLNPRVKIVSSGTYTLVTNLGNGCSDTDEVFIQANPAAIANAGADQLTCEDDSLSLNGTAGPGTFVWSPPTGISSTTVLNPKVVPNTGTPYVLSVTNTYGCNAKDTVYAIRYPDPEPSVGNDTSVCQYTYFSLKTQVAVGGSSFSWTPQNKVYTSTLQNPFVFADSQRTYKVVVTTPDGCVDSDEIQVNIYPKPVADAGPDTSACLGMPANLHGNGAGTGGSYAWYPPTDLSSAVISNPVVTVNQNRLYDLVVTTVYGCKDTNDVNVVLNPDPIADAGPDTVVCLWQAIQLTGKTGTLYRWQPIAGLDNAYIATPKAYISGPATYQLKVYNQFGCSSIDTVNITVKPSPESDAGPDTAVCVGQWINLNGRGGSTYFSWYPANLVSSPFVLNPLVHADKKTVYSLIVSNVQGCSDTDEVVVDVNPYPVADAGPDTTVCAGDRLLLKGSGGGDYLWSPATGLNNPTSANPELQANSKTTFVLIVTNAFNCKHTDTVEVDVYPKPLAGAGNDTSVCPGATILLKGSGGGDYLWSPSVGLSDSSKDKPVAQINNVISYRVVVTNSFGCTDTAIVVIDTLPVKFAVEQPGYICAGDELVLNASGGDVYTWWPTGLVDGNGGANPVVKPNESTMFGVEIKESVCGRFDTLYINTNVLPLPVLQIDAIDIDCARAYGELMATGAVDYKWWPEDGLDNPEAAHTIARPQASTRYVLTGTDKEGCVDTASVLLDVLQGDGRLFVPDAFTPNNDGVNDCYKVFVPGDVTQFEFSIYNRYGERVFHATDRSHCWDGSYKGIPAEVSTYFYYYTATSSVCGQVFRKGDMHLIR